jgi:small-conductance mechanosensitive channel
VGGRFAAIVAATLLLAGGFASAALAQSGATPAPAAAPAAAPPAEEPKPVPISEVPTRVEEVPLLLQQIEASLAPEARVAEIEAGLAERSARLQERATQTAASIGNVVDLSELDSIRQFWNLERSALVESDETLKASAARLEEQLAQLATLEKTWKVTLERLGEEHAPAALVERVRAVQKQIKSTRSRVKSRRAEVLTAQSGAAQDRTRADEMLRAIGDAEKLLLSNLLVRDRPPLWALERPEGAPGVVEALRASFERGGQSLRDFVTARSGVLPEQVALLSGLLAAAFWLRARARRLEADDEDVRRATVFVQRPVSAALVLWLLASPFPTSGAPPSARLLFVALSLVPILRIVPPLLESSLVPVAWILAGLTLVDRLRAFLSDLPRVEQWLFVGQTLAALCLAIWLLRRRTLDALFTSEGGARRANLLLRLAALLLGVALVAHVLGYVRLGSLIADGTLRSAAVTLPIYAGARMLEGAVGLALRARSLRDVRIVQRYRERISRRTRRGVRLLAAGLWAFAVLGLFGLREQTLAAAKVVFTTHLEVGELALSFGDVVVFVLALWLSYLASRLVRSLLQEEVFSRVHLQRGVPHAISSFAGYTVLLIGILIALAAAGIGFSRIALIASALGVGIGFGLQNIVNDVVSGWILLFERPIQIGDTVQMTDLVGEVTRVGLRSSTVRTWEGAEVIVPNAELTGSRVVNWTLSDRRRRLDIAVGVAYGSDPVRVLEVLAAVAKKHAAVLDDPAPAAFFMAFGESSLDFQLRVWTDQIDTFLRTKSDLHVAVNEALRAAGFEIPFPQRDLHLRSVQTDLTIAARSREEDERKERSREAGS